MIKVIVDFTLGRVKLSKNTQVKTEKLIYPLSLLVVEFGGTLGIFFQFSFMTLWDQINLLGYCTGTLKTCDNAFWNNKLNSFNFIALHTWSSFELIFSLLSRDA